MTMTATTTPAGRDIPTRKLLIVLGALLLSLLVYFTSIKPAVREHTLQVRADRRAACSAVPAATESAIRAGLLDLDGQVVRSMRAKPSDDGWWMVTANVARPDVPRGFTGEMLTWRVRDAGGVLEIQSVDRFARELSSFDASPSGVDVGATGAHDSRWCAKNAALSP